jgi:O-methyltransferase
MKRLVRNAFRHFGFDIVRYSKPRPLPSLPDVLDDEAHIVTQVAPFTLTSPERVVALIHAVKYVTRYRVQGDVVECGVWRGGSLMAVALSLLKLGDTGRQLFLYDTFEGMSPPTDRDVDMGGRAASSQSSLVGPRTRFAVSLDEVKDNLYSTGYPRERIHFVKGRVEDTIPATGPKQISLLRLDTDWYESTKHELTHLYPRLAHHGVVIIDDYGAWQGARLAVDEYFGMRSEPVFLHRIDDAGRMIVRGGS